MWGLVAIIVVLVLFYLYARRARSRASAEELVRTSRIEVGTEVMTTSGLYGVVTARNVDGTVIMYADKETAAMKAALAETDRRRAIQLKYNEDHGITAASIVKGISDIAEFLQGESKTPKGRRRSERKRGKDETMTSAELEKTIIELEEEMLAAAEDLRFEYAARLRDEIRELRRDLRQLTDLEAPA